jgi:phosphate:Na+ symporter
MSSAGTNVNAKRTAVVHLLFNTFGCLIFIAPIWIWKGEVTGFFAGISNDVGQQIAIFHTLFNLVTTAILLPVSPFVVKLACLIIPEKSVEEDQFKFMYIDDRMLSTPPVAVGNLRKEIVRMGEIAKTNINDAVAMLIDENVDNIESIRENEDMLNKFNKNITAYLTKLLGKELSEEDDKKVGSYYHVVSDIERVGDYAENVMEYVIRLKEEGLVLSDDAKGEITLLLEKVNTLYQYSFTAFDDRNVTLLQEVERAEEEVDEYTRHLQNRHIERLKAGDCTAQAGSIFLQTISNLERVGDHINNVAKSIKQYKYIKNA